jgi:hypothetical protein
MEVTLRAELDDLRSERDDAVSALESRLLTAAADEEAAREALLADAAKTEARLSAEIEKVSTALAAAEDARYAAEQSSDVKEKESKAAQQAEKALLEEREALAAQTAKLVDDLATTIASASQDEAAVLKALASAGVTMGDEGSSDPTTAKKLAEVKELNRKISAMKTTLASTVGDMRGVEDELRRRLEVAESAALKVGWCSLTSVVPGLTSG